MQRQHGDTEIPSAPRGMTSEVAAWSNTTMLDEVPQDVYTTEYFLTKRGGADEFQESAGAKLSELAARLLAMAEPGPGCRLLDVGCGCGELVIHATMQGADATGIDYADAAHEIAVETSRRLGVEATFLKRDVSDLPDGPFDAIVMADIVEHLYQHQLDKLYAAARERLAPGGTLIVHTWPNRWHTTYSYPVTRLHLLLVGIKKPRSPRKPHDEIMHVNEQSAWSLRRDLRRAGFSPKIWLEHPMPTEPSLVYRVAHEAPGLRLLFADHLFAIAKVG